MEVFRREKPAVVAALEKAAASIEGQELVLAFSPQNRFHGERALKEKDALNERLAAMAAVHVRVSFVEARPEVRAEVNWTVTQPVDSGYVIRVWYVDGSGNWLVSDDSSPTFAITTGTLPVPTVTQPGTAGPFTQGSVVSVAWDVAYAGSTGMFHTYAYKDGAYYWLDSQAASGAGSYSFNWTVTQPVDSGYVVRVWYVDGSGNWLISDDSSPAFAIATGTIPTPTVTLPNTAGPFGLGSSVSVVWTVAYAATTGTFHTYVYKDGTYHLLNSRAASGAGSYGFSWTVTQPTGTGYVIRVWYVDGSGNWLVFDDSSPVFAIN